jgi:Uma2 family endonuclease
MSRVGQAPATLEDLYREAGKAELIGGKIVRFMPTGFKPGRIGGRIYRSLDDYAEQIGRGVAYPDNVGFAISILPSGRQSFSPDAAYYLGPLPENPMHFLDGPPTLAVEVRSENDYGDAAEEEMTEKRSDYFAAGTLVVWDVDPVDECIHVYRAAQPDQPSTYRRGQLAEAEPAVPGWQVPVDWIFAEKTGR